MFKKGIKVSVIISVYNTENYLRKCLDSLVGQTLKEIEIIAINNGSTDGSEDILKEYESKYQPMMRVINFEKNTGDPAEPWNKGIEVASGEYISIVDSDDWCEKNAYKRYYEVAKRGNYNIVISNHYEVRENNELLPVGSIDYNHAINTKELLLNPHLAPWGKIIKRSVFVENNLKYKSQIHCDTGLNMILYSKVDNVYCITDYLYYYNQMNPNSETNTKKRMRQSQIVDTLDYVIERYNKQWEQEEIFSLMYFLHWFCFYEYKFHMDVFFPFIRKHAKEIRRNKYIKQNYRGMGIILKLLNKEIVPPKIVYASFGNHKINNIEKKCIESWRTYTQGYEFISITEENFDISKYKMIEKAYLKADYRLAEKLAVLIYVQKNGGIGISKKLKMNAPIGELRINDLSYAVTETKNVYMSFVACTSENQMIKLLLDRLSNDLKDFTYDEFEKIVNDFVGFISPVKDIPFNTSKFSTKVFSLNRIGINITSDNLFEMMDEDICAIKSGHKNIGIILNQEDGDYVRSLLDRQSKMIDSLSSRINQIENSRSWRYAHIIAKLISRLRYHI